MPKLPKETKTKPWFVYILLCNDDTYYTGVAIDLDKRLELHKSGKGAKYTRAHGANKIVFSEQHKTRSQALVREAEIKKLSRKEKVKSVSYKSQTR